MRSLSALFLVVSLSLACNKEKPAAPAEPAEKKEQPSKKSEAKDEDKPVEKKKTAKKPEPPPQKQKADSDKLSTYWKAMNEGRKATLAKKYDDANAAFDKALKAMPDDARALSERGYAKLLAKDWKGAVSDLDKAVVRTSDKKLLGQIYYNYGLAAEGQGDAEAARAAFARSNTYNPTPAAQKKLGGKSSCPAVIELEKPTSNHETFASWKAAYEHIAGDDGALEKWSSEETTLKTFCSNPWKKGAACVAVINRFMLHELYVLTPTSEGKIASFGMEMVGGRCGGDIEAKLVSDEGDVTHVHWKAMQGIPTMVVEKNGEIVECGEKDDDCMTACGGDATTLADLFIAKDKGEPMLYVGREEDAGKDPVTIKVEMPTVTIKGKGCDVERPLAR